MMQGRAYGPMNAGGFWKLGKARKWILPYSLQKEPRPVDPL